MSSLPYAAPPHSVRLADVILVQCERGEGDLRRGVLQVFHPNGDLLAEHDSIHEDPVYASYHLRDTRYGSDMHDRSGATEAARASLGSPHPPLDPIVNSLPEGAHIVIGVDLQREKLHMRTVCWGRIDSDYALLDLKVLPSEVVRLVAELKAQLLAGAERAVGS